MSVLGETVGGAITGTRDTFIPRTLQGWFLAVTRIAIGWMWLEATMWKVPPRFGCPADFAFTTDIARPTTGLCDWIGRQATYGTLEPYRAFLTGFVMPNIQLVGWGVYFAELAVAISLILGVFTVFGGLLGAAQGLNLLLGFQGVPHEWPWTYIFLVIINLFLAFFAAGRTLGVDHWLRRWLAGKAGLFWSLLRWGT